MTLPNQATKSDLSWNVLSEEGTRKVYSCEYNGQTVGWATGDFSVIYAPVQLSFERMVDVQTVSSAGESIQIESLDEVLTQAGNIFQAGRQIVIDYAKNNTMTVLIGGLILLVVLIIFIVILIFRATSDARIRRRRRLEEAERIRREEEIDRMTTAEIEAELRAVMEQERMRREQEQRALAEAERAAEEARKMEAKAHETEQLLEELERERQERLASQKNEGINN